MRINILEYIKSVSETNPVISFLLSVITYILFPEQAYLTAFCAVLGAMLIDVITKYYAIAKNNGGLWKSLKNRHINSNSMWVGTSRKVFTYLIIFIMVGLSYRVSPVAGATTLIGTFVYALLFFREFQSILENLADAGSDVNWLLAVVKKRKKKILEDEGVEEDELDNK